MYRQELIISLYKKKTIIMCVHFVIVPKICPITIKKLTLLYFCKSYIDVICMDFSSASALFQEKINLNFFKHLVFENKKNLSVMFFLCVYMACNILIKNIDVQEETLARNGASSWKERFDCYQWRLALVN